MKENVELRAVALGQYIVESGATVRAAAKKFGVSKSTVHKDTDRLRHIDTGLYLRVRQVLEQNKAERHLRGGEATRKKYKGE
jgi:putative DeoR family transcriptional regulator (stage III sporulation protein D)